MPAKAKVTAATRLLTTGFHFPSDAIQLRLRAARGSADVNDGQRRYAAFLSYSHRDAAAARALHRRLESYRIPRRLVGSEGERGPVPARLTPIFRDREELPAAGDLSETVRAALAVSDALVILCSPAAAASPWVAKEIDTFRALHPDRPIIAAILEGEPSEAFPPPLCAGGIEPLAADLRPGRDGRRLGVLKLVAGLSGVGLDALVQRDAQRRLRRVTAVTGVALAAVVAMAVLTTIALQARREAQRQRAEAEGLVEFMLTDLRDRLKGVGRLDVLTAVNQRALSYYGSSRDLRRLADGSLSRRARILLAIGDDRLSERDVRGAVAAYQEARRTTAEQLARHRSDPERLLDHARTEYRFGKIYELRREWPKADRHYQAFARAADQLVAAGPYNVWYLGEAAAAKLDLAGINQKRSDFAAAERFYRGAEGLLARAAQLKPGYSHTLFSQAKAFGGIAEALSGEAVATNAGSRSVGWRRARVREALQWRRKQYSIVQQMLTSDPGDYEARAAVVTAERGLACTLFLAGERAAAAAHFESGWRLAGNLSKWDPGNRDWRLLSSRLAADMIGGRFRQSSALTEAAAHSDKPACTINRSVKGVLR